MDYLYLCCVDEAMMMISEPKSILVHDFIILYKYKFYVGNFKLGYNKGKNIYIQIMIKMLINKVIICF